MKRKPKTDMPHSVDAERAILGAILLDNMAFYQTDRLKVDDFMIQSHQILFRRMLDIIEDQRPIDFVTTTQELEKHEELIFVGGVVWVTSLTDGLPRVKNIEQYVNIVIEHARRRRIIQMATSLQAAAYESFGPVNELITRADRELLEIENTRDSGPKHISEVLSEVNRIADSHWQMSTEREAIGLRTGLVKLDQFTTGYRRREVVVIAGWSGDGKTSLLRQFLVAQALDNNPGLIFSREISREQLTDDLKCLIANVRSDHARDKRKMDLCEREAYREADKLISKWPIWIDDTRGLHIEEAVHRARRFTRTEGLVWVAADYLQLFLGSGSNQTEKLEHVCEGFWNLADGENVAMVALSQLSRDKDKLKRPPRLADLKGASRIEHDAHLVEFVYRPEGDSGKFTRNDEIIIPKQRHGGTGWLHVEFNTENLTFQDRDVKYE
jgi:replicative DNA helicase